MMRYARTFAPNFCAGLDYSNCRLTSGDEAAPLLVARTLENLCQPQSRLVRLQDECYKNTMREDELPLLIFPTTTAFKRWLAAQPDNSPVLR